GLNPSYSAPFQMSSTRPLEDVAQDDPLVVSSGEGAMKQGSTLPLAVTYVERHGRVQPDQGRWPSTGWSESTAPSPITAEVMAGMDRCRARTAAIRRCFANIYETAHFVSLY